MSIIQAKKRTDTDDTIELQADDDGNLYVNAGDIDAVVGGEQYYDGTVVDPLEPTKGQVLFGVTETTETIYPLCLTEDRKVKVDVEIDLNVPPLPPSGTQNAKKMFATYLSSGGGSSSKVDHNVSATPGSPSEFYIDADPNADLYITQLTIIIADSQVKLNYFGNIRNVSDGWHLIFKQDSEDLYLIEDAKTCGEVVTQSVPTNTFSDHHDTSLIESYNQDMNDAIMIQVDLEKLCPGGLRIGRGTTDRITSVVRDDFTGLNQFTIRATGYKVV